MSISINKDGEGYFHGDKCKVTGKLDKTTYSFPIHELVFLDGINKGESFWQPVNTIFN